MGFLSTWGPVGPSIGQTANAAEIVQSRMELSGFGVCAFVWALVEVLVRILLQIGDRLVEGRVDTTGVAADDPVDEGGGLVEILCGGQQVGVLPDSVASIRADGLRQALPQHRG